MKNELKNPAYWAFGIALHAILISAAAGSVHAEPRNCRELYGAIKSVAMYCGFSCEQDELAPLQASYEAQCIVSVVPASAFGFDSSPEPSALLPTCGEQRARRAEDDNIFETGKWRTMRAAILEAASTLRKDP